MRSLIVEADGGSRGNPGPAAYGAVVRDAPSGTVLAEIAEYIGEATNNVAEYRGCIEGLRHAYSIDPRANVEVRLDSKLVVEQMSGRWQVKHPAMRELAKEARSIFEPGRVSYCWVPREQNGLADALVNEMLDLQQSEGSVSIRRLNGHLTEDRAAEDLVGGIEVEHARAMVADQAPKNVMIGWADLAIPTTTVLARHGATALSLEKRFSGRGGFDAPLAPLGERQAQALAEELALREPFDRIISSPLLRTRQTAHFVANRLGLPVEVEDGFAECGFGDWDGLTFSEVKNRWPNHLEEWLASTSVAPPGGESFEQCHDRVERARHAVVKRCAGERVLIVAHVTPIKLLVSTAVGAPLQSLFRMELMPCSISTLAWFPDGNASMFTFAESAHLRGIPIPAGT